MAISNPTRSQHVNRHIAIATPRPALPPTGPHGQSRGTARPVWPPPRDSSDTTLLGPDECAGYPAIASVAPGARRTHSTLHLLKRPG